MRRQLHAQAALPPGKVPPVPIIGLEAGCVPQQDWTWWRQKSQWRCTVDQVVLSMP